MAQFRPRSDWSSCAIHVASVSRIGPELRILEGLGRPEMGFSDSPPRGSEHEFLEARMF